jgi:predicted O-methyltransferase YrrM
MANPVDRELATSKQAMRPSAVPRQQVQAVIDRLVREGTAIARSDGTSHDLFPVAISAEEGESLRNWVIREGATYTIEVGLGYGISTLYICDGLLSTANAAVHHVAIDPNQSTRFADCGLQFLEDAGIRNIVEHHSEESQIVLPRLLSDARQFDLAFVDGNHRFDGALVDLVLLRRLVRPGGTVFVDDFQLPSVSRAVSFCVTNLGWTFEELATSEERHHWAVLRTDTHADTRAFDHFVEF